MSPDTTRKNTLAPLTMVVKEISAAKRPSERIASIDILRGLVIVLMMLDHSRDFIHRGALLDQPTNLGTTTPLLFLTRWVTHFCAPTFVFLAGISAQIQSIRGKSTAALSRWLLARGVFLIVLELSVLRPLIWFNLDYSFLAHLQIIWAIGWSMIALAALVWLPTWLVAIVGVLLVAGHNFWDDDRVSVPPSSFFDTLWLILHQGGFFRASDPWGLFQSIDPGGPFVLVHYPLIPWIGLILLGYVTGMLYRESARDRIAKLAAAGGLVILGFILLRWSNVYGDPNPWIPAPDRSTQLTGWQWSLFSFLNTEKYPPSLLFLGMTIGPALVFLAIFDQHKPGWMAKRLMVFGGVPLFFYILQWPAVHLISRGMQWLAGQPLGWDGYNPFDPNYSVPDGIGFGLGMVYAGWLIALIALYPLCKLFRDFKRSHPAWRWLSFF